MLFVPDSTTTYCPVDERRAARERNGSRWPHATHPTALTAGSCTRASSRCLRAHVSSRRRRRIGARLQTALARGHDNSTRAPRAPEVRTTCRALYPAAPCQLPFPCSALADTMGSKHRRVDSATPLDRLPATAATHVSYSLRPAAPTPPATLRPLERTPAGRQFSAIPEECPFAEVLRPRSTELRTVSDP